MGKNKLVHIDGLSLVHQTDRALLVETEDGEEIWIPKSQVNYIVMGAEAQDDKGRTVKEITTFTIEEWVAKSKGLI